MDFARVLLCEVSQKQNPRENDEVTVLSVHTREDLWSVTALAFRTLLLVLKVNTIAVPHFEGECLCN